VPDYRAKDIDLMIGEALLLADQLREWTRDDPRLAPRTIRLRALLVETLDGTATQGASDALPITTAPGSRINLEQA
jgi:hypothetical protein